MVKINIFLLKIMSFNVSSLSQQHPTWWLIKLTFAYILIFNYPPSVILNYFHYILKHLRWPFLLERMNFQALLFLWTPSHVYSWVQPIIFLIRLILYLKLLLHTILLLDYLVYHHLLVNHILLISIFHKNDKIYFHHLLSLH